MAKLRGKQAPHGMREERRGKVKKRGNSKAEQSGVERKRLRKAAEGSARCWCAGREAGNGNLEQLEKPVEAQGVFSKHRPVVSGEGGAEEVPFLKTRGMNK